MLKDIYAAVKNERILLPSPEGGSGTVAAGRTSGTFAPNGGRRKVGKGSDRMTALKRGSIRGIQGLLGGMGSNPSLVESSVIPNPTRSSVDPWGRTAQSLGVSSGDSMLPPLPCHSLLQLCDMKISVKQQNTEDNRMNHIRAPKHRVRITFVVPLRKGRQDTIDLLRLRPQEQLIAESTESNIQPQPTKVKVGKVVRARCTVDRTQPSQPLCDLLSLQESRLFFPALCRQLLCGCSYGRCRNHVVIRH